MRIRDIEYIRLDMPLAVPYTIAYETVTATTNIILKLVTDGGFTGWGCAAPDPAVTGEAPDDVVHNLEKVVMSELMDRDPFHVARTMHEMKQLVPGASSTLAMVDMALHDLLARRARLPLYKVLGGYRDSIATSITIGILPLEETLKQAGEFLGRGFTILKLKGGLNLEEDIEKVLKLREHLGSGFLLRFDANQGYTTEQSVAFIRKTKKAGIEIFEQPTHQKKDEVLGEVTQQVDVPVMADESIKTLKDTFRLAKNDRIDMVNIKLMKMGGILEGMHINSVAKAAGMEVMVGCLDECALGIAAGLHFALSRPNIEFADLDGHLDLLEDPFSGLFRLEEGVLYPTEDAGLGKIAQF